MVQTRKERKAGKMHLAQPDRSGPSEQTLLDLAQERDLFGQADRKQNKAAPSPNAQDLMSPSAERIMETALYSLSLATLHLMFDALVQHQYAMEVSWPSIFTRAILAVVVFSLLVYVFHPHYSSPVLLPILPQKYQEHLRQAIFFGTGISAGCYLIYITNEFSYIAVLKRAPPLGCLWVWSVLELNLPLAVASVACAGGYFWQGGYAIG
jgi:hypothetical protein